MLMRRTIILLVFLLSFLGMGATVSLGMEIHPSQDTLGIGHVEMTTSHALSEGACCTDGGATCPQFQCGTDFISSKLMLADHVEMKTHSYRRLPFDFSFGGNFEPTLGPPRI